MLDRADQPPPDLPSAAPFELPALDQVLASAHAVRLPLLTRFRGIDHREALLLQGPYGWGEFAPFVEYEDAEAARWLASAIEAAWAPPVPARRDVVPVNATVPAVRPAQVAGVLARFAGCTTAKVKVAERGQELADDVARVAEVRALLGPGGRIRIDANGGWTVDAAVHALGALARFGLEYVEQPCASLAELTEARLGLARAGVDVAIAADESIRKAEDPLRVAVAGAADVAVVKVAPLGGVRAALVVADRLGREHGLAVVVSSALDTSVGLATGVELAAALPELPYACGLGTAGLLADDVVQPGLCPMDGVVPVRRVVPDQAALTRTAADADRTRWWLERLRRCYALLDVT